MAGRGCRTGRPQPRDRLTESRVRTRSGLLDATYPIEQRGRPARATARGCPKTGSLGSATVLAYRASSVAARPPSGVESLGLDAVCC